MRDVFIIITGGTIDKTHDPVTEDLIFDGKSYVPDILLQSRVAEIQHEILILKDSLDMDDKDRKAILEASQARPEKSIIITHGTGTMEKTAEYLKGKMEEKIVVLTGAMRPASMFLSDAGFNLGSAITATHLLEPGVYIAMNGRIFEAGHVTKDTQTGLFKPT